MRYSSRARRFVLRGVPVFRLGGLGLTAAVLCLVGGGGCGRIGYDPLPEKPIAHDGGPRLHDAQGGGESSVVETGAPAEGGDSTVDDAPVDVASEPSADASPCVASAAVDYCSTIPPLPAPPVIDGVLDCGPILQPIVPVGWRGAAPLPPFPSGNTAKVAAAWRSDGLYVFVDVTTPVAIPPDLSSPAYYGAGVEIFVDDDGAFATPGRYDTPGTVQMIVPSPVASAPDASVAACPVDASADAPDGADASLSADGASTDAALADGAPADATADAPVEAGWTGPRAQIYRNETSLGPWTSSRFGTFPKATGFAFEGFFAAADLGLTTWTLTAGASVGFDVGIDVSFPDVCTIGVEGHRAGQYFFYEPMNPADAGPDASPIGPPFADSRSFCTPTLSAM